MMSYNQKSLAKNLYTNLINSADSDFFSEALDALGINYSIIDVNGNYLTQNNSAIKRISNGLLKAQEIDKVTWEDCQMIMRNGKRVIKEELFRNSTYLSIKQPIFKDNICNGLSVISLNLTDKKQAEIAKTEFLKNMSHDIRTPFSGILGIARLLQSDEIDPLKQAYLENLIGSSERLLALLNQTLEIAHIGSQPLDFSDVNLKEVIQEVEELMLAALKLKGLTLNVNTPDINLNTDKYRLSRILINLISNAIKFTQVGGITIRVETQPKLKITIEDTGIGIPEDKLQIIFNKFTKLKSSGESQIFTGSGTGLYIAKQFAIEIGGDILVESVLGKGSKFSFVQL